MARRRRRAAHLVEFALTLPVWLLLILGILEFGWAFYQRGLLGFANERACRAVAVHMRQDVPSSRASALADGVANTALASFPGGACADCSVSLDLQGAPPHQVVRCAMRRDLARLTPIIPTSHTLTSTQQRRVERQR